jgi:hypothetical protein
MPIECVPLDRSYSSQTSAAKIAKLQKPRGRRAENPGSVFRALGCFAQGPASPRCSGCGPRGQGGSRKRDPASLENYGVEMRSLDSPGLAASFVAVGSRAFRFQPPDGGHRSAVGRHFCCGSRQELISSNRSIAMARADAPRIECRDVPVTITILHNVGIIGSGGRRTIRLPIPGSESQLLRLS